MSTTSRSCIKWGWVINLLFLTKWAQKGKTSFATAWKVTQRWGGRPASSSIILLSRFVSWLWLQRLDRIKTRFFGFLLCSYAAGLWITVGGWYQVDAVQKTRSGNFSEAHVTLLANIWLKGPGARHVMNFSCCFEMQYHMLKRPVKLQLSGDYLKGSVPKTLARTDAQLG